MNRFISLLRGINVSGQKKILMADLKKLYVEAGCQNVITYIQSGNVIFDFPSDDKEKIITILEKAIESKYAFQVPIDLRTDDEIEKIYNALPFENISLEEDGSRILIGFMSRNPVPDEITSLRKFQHETEDLIIKDDILYLHCPNGFGKSKLSNTNIESKLNVVSTTRNLKTVAKLCALSRGES